MKTQKLNSRIGVGTMRKLVGKIALAAAVMATVAGCAGEVVDIDRTQANSISKEIFNGEWYYRPMVVEAQWSQALTFEGYEWNMDRIKWRIEENRLIGFKSYETQEGAEHEASEVDFQGGPVVSFRILSHFDKVREYNPATGDQTNVIVEDSRTRPWWEREYMRVDWSTNTIGYNREWNWLDWGAMSKASSLGGQYIQANEIDNPYRAEVNANNINVVGDYMMSNNPRICMAAGIDPFLCAPSNVKIKLSFMRVTDSDYEPLYYPDYVPYYEIDEEGNLTDKPLVECSTVDPTNCTPRQEGLFARFGFFRTNRMAYDNEFGWTRGNRVYLANRWNIWSNAKNPDGSFKPMHQRDPGQIVYHKNVDFPTDNAIAEGTNKLVDEWDQSFRSTIAARKSLATEADGVTPVPPVTWDEIPNVFIALDNDCSIENANTVATNGGYTDVLMNYGIDTITQGNLKRACSVLEWASNGDFTWQKDGDLRHSFLKWVDTPMLSGPLGYGPSAADPITGELISANSNIYGASIDRLSAYAADLVQLMNDNIEIADFMAGTYIRGREVSGEMGSVHTHAGMHNRAHSHHKMADVAKRVRAKAQLPVAPNAGQAPEDAAKHALEMNVHNASLHPMMAEMSHHHSDAKLKKIRGTWFDREVLTSDELRKAVLGNENQQQALAGSLGQDALDDFTALSWATGDDNMLTMQNEARNRISSESIMMADWADDGMASVAAELQGMTWDQVYDYMRENIYRAVMAHEVGHTIGLRHNFGGSMDPLNYIEDFWAHWNPDTKSIKYRNDDGTPTKAERQMYSSIMDYDARFYADSFEGIGPYDNAAIHFGYGMLLEAFDHGDSALGYESLIFLNHYNDIPAIFDGSLSCSTQFKCHPDYYAANGYYNDYVDAANAATAAQNDGDLATADAKDQEADYFYELYNRYLNSYYKNALENTTPDQYDMDGNLLAVQNLHKRKYVTFEAYHADWTQYWNDIANPQLEADLVPYEFCTDEYRYPSNIGCQVWDKGANFHEAILDRAQRHQAYYIIDTFRRDRVNFSESFYRNYSRYFSPMSVVYRYFLYGNNGFGYDADGKYTYLSDFPVGQTWQAAALDGMNYLTSVLNQPEAGMHCLQDGVYVSWEDLDGNLLPGCAEEDLLEVPMGIGKDLRSKYTDEYDYKLTRMGNYWDKLAAIIAITSNEGSFVRDYSDWLDSGSFTLSYWRGLQDEVMDMFTPWFTGDVGKHNWRVTDAGQFKPGDVVDIYDIENEVTYEGTPIQSAWSWNLRWYAIVYTMARFNSMYDYTADFSDYTRICLDGYMDCMDFSDLDGNPRLTSFVDPVTGYEYHAPGDIADARAALTVAEAAAAAAPGNEALELQLEEAEHDVRMLLAAKLLEEAQQFADGTYVPAKTAYDAALLAMEAEATTENQEAFYEAEMALDEAVRGINDRTAFFDLLRYMAEHF